MKRGLLWALRSSLLVGTTATALADGGAIPLLVTGFRIEDENGDRDGFADTNETVTVHFHVWNESSTSFSMVEVRFVTADPKVNCVTASVPVGDLAPHAESAPLSFKFKVSALADRGGTTATCNANVCSNFTGGCVSPANCPRTVQHDYSVTFRIEVLSFESSQPNQSLRVDLDLNAVNTAIPSTTFTEGFESGLGSFVPMTLDANIASNSASDGKRCQYNDPDYPNSNAYGLSECYLGFAAGQPVQNDWHPHTTTALDGGRAFLGNGSLHYGIHTAGAPNRNVYGLSQMDAVRTGILNLAAWVCEGDPSNDKRACVTDSDCLAVGGPCAPARPQLSFKHQVSTLDWRQNSVPMGTSIDRAVVMAQVYPTGIWQKLVPYFNTYDAQGTDEIGSCLFDPDDDGNDEDDFFDPSDPYRRLGPSSTCSPELAFSFLGDTDELLDATKIGRASHGPGLFGSVGIGVWVESRIDLSAYRGRRILLRWLFTSVKVSDSPTTRSVWHSAQTPVDDGWFVDDVRVTQTLGAAIPTTSLDNADNSALAPCDLDGDGISSPADNCPNASNADQSDADSDGVGDACDLCPAQADPTQVDSDRDAIGDACDACPLDPFNINSDQDGPCDLEDNCPALSNSGQQNADGDGGGDACDCAPADPSAWALVEVEHVRFWSDKVSLYWPSLATSTGNGTVYEVARGFLAQLPAGAGGSETCLAPQPYWGAYDYDRPPVGAGFWYLVRMRNACGTGTFGLQSDQTERTSDACP